MSATDIVGIRRFVKAVLVATAMLACADGEAFAYAGKRDDVQRMLVEQAATSRNVPPSLALAVAKVESNFNPNAHSSAGARGVMQIMPATGRGVFGVHPDHLWDARLNVELGVRYLDDLIDQYGGRWDLALSHYNGGSRVGTPPNARVIPATQDYVDSVLAWQRKFERSDTVLAMASTAQAPRRVPAPAKGSLRYGEVPSDYMMFDDPRASRDWRHYLGVADFWLRKPWKSGEIAKSQEPAATQPERAATPAASEAPAATGYWPVSDSAAERPSMQLRRSIEERRAVFREQLNGFRSW